MAEKNLNSRIINKHDIEANWVKATNFIPKQGEIIVYDKDDNYNYPRVKIGDGVTTVVALPFIDDNTLQVADFPQALTDAGVVKSVAGKTPNASGEVALVPADIGAATSEHTHNYVPTSRTVNGKALSSNISLTYSDVGAAAGSHTHSDYVTKNMFSLSGTTLTITTT